MAEPVATREIVLTRADRAPRQRVFQMWTDPDHLARWWGPDGFTAPKVTSDPRAGGEVGLESSHAVTFAEVDGGTLVTVEARAALLAVPTLAALEGMRAGWSQSLQCLDDALTGADDRLVLLGHRYDAPPEVVLPCWLEEAHLRRWWGPDGFTCTTHEAGFRAGGRWGFTMHGPDGTDHPDLLTYDEIVPNERIVYTHGTPGAADPPFTGVVTFEEMAGGTVVSLRLAFDSPAPWDQVEERYHAHQGGAQTLARLGHHLAAERGGPGRWASNRAMPRASGRSRWASTTTRSSRDDDRWSHTFNGTS